MCHKKVLLYFFPYLHHLLTNFWADHLAVNLKVWPFATVVIRLFSVMDVLWLMGRAYGKTFYTIN